MTKGDEIRIEVFFILQRVRRGILSEHATIVQLQELGLVINIDRDLPTTEDCSCPSEYIAKLRKVGFDVLVIEPLIKE